MLYVSFRESPDRKLSFTVSPHLGAPCFSQTPFASAPSLAPDLGKKDKNNELKCIHGSVHVP